VTPHFILLVRQDAEIAPGLRRTQQYEALGAVLREVGIRIALVDAAFQQLARTRQASALVANRGQPNTRPRGGVPDVLVFVTLDRLRPFGRFENNVETLSR
jgi:hypothetical protein